KPCEAAGSCAITCGTGDKCLPNADGVCACRHNCAASPDFPQGLSWTWGSGYEFYPGLATFSFLTPTSGTIRWGSFSGTLTPGGDACLVFERDQWTQYGFYWEFTGTVDPDGCGFEGCMRHKYHDHGAVKEKRYLDCAGSHNLGHDQCGVRDANGQPVVHGT